MASRLEWLVLYVGALAYNVSRTDRVCGALCMRSHPWRWVAPGIAGMMPPARQARARDEALPDPSMSLTFRCR